MKELYKDKDRMIESDGRSIHLVGRKEITIPTYKISMSTSILPQVAKQLSAMGENPANWYAIKDGAGNPVVVLPTATKTAILEAIQMGKDLDAENNRIANLPENKERRAIDDLYDRADRLERSNSDDNVAGPARLRAEARNRMAAWREKYEDAAKKEDRRNSLDKAATLRQKAVGALVYDADGILSREEQQARHDELIRQAEEIERKAQ